VYGYSCEECASGGVVLIAVFLSFVFQSLVLAILVQVQMFVALDSSVTPTFKFAVGSFIISDVIVM
jgi:hypothetical protein